MIQIVFIKWGTKFSSAYVNGVVAAVRARTDREVRFVCFTDDASGIDDGIEARPFPDLGVPFDWLIGRRGTLPKIGIFLEGALEPDLPTIYLDLDSAITGDVARMSDCLKAHRSLYLLQRHAVPHWRARGLVHALDADRYYLGNTAFMAFYPGDWHHVARTFMDEFPRWRADPAQFPAFKQRIYTEGNERIISYAARHNSRVFPRDVAVKFTQEYMAPSLALARARNAMPWVKARRARQVALTFHGDVLKPHRLAEMREGEVVRWKHHVTEWRYPEITAFWQDVLKDERPA